jgi:uncharacterized membrane protein
MKSPRLINVNKVHADSLSAVDRLAVGITSAIGTMGCVLVFAVLTLISLPAVLADGNVITIVGWLAQTFLQLVLLPLLMVGQNLQGRHSELRAENDFQVNVKAEDEIETILNRLSQQDEQILKIVTHVAQIPKHPGTLEQVEK